MLNPDGQVNDFERVDFIHGHLAAVLSAIEAGVNVAGYFHWSLMDNFEWAWGYQRRFGLYHVEFATQRRTPKLSASLLRQHRRLRRAARPTRPEWRRAPPRRRRRPGPGVLVLGLGRDENAGRGRVAQWESARFTRERSLVQAQPCP